MVETRREQKPKNCSEVGNKKVLVRHLHVTRGAINARRVAATISIRLLCGSHYPTLSRHALSVTDILTAYNFYVCVISGFRPYVNGIGALLGYYAASSGNSLETFPDNPSVPFSRFKVTVLLKMVQKGPTKGQGQCTLENGTERSH